MPELPEVETIARALAPLLTGRMVKRARLARSDVVFGTTESLERVLPRRQILRIYRRAKRLVFEVTPSAQLVFHLGMTGRVTMEAPGAPLEPHTHLRMGFEGIAQELRFRDSRRFGGVWFLEGGPPPARVGRRLGPLGIEPLDATVRSFRELLGTKRRIKALLMDQARIAGLGNIYCDESLHRAGIHPCAPAWSLDNRQSADLLRAIKTVLRSAIRFNGSTLMDFRTVDGVRGSFQERHRVYQRDGQPCRTCGTEIVRLIVSGRSTFVCPRCQAEPKSRRVPSGVMKRRNV